MEDGDEPVWYANSTDPYHTLKHSGGCLVMVFAVPFVLGTGLAAGRPGPGVGWALLALSLPLLIAAVAAGWEFAGDRRLIVQMRLRPATIELVRANGRPVRYPLGELERVEVVRNVVVMTAHSSTVLLFFNGRLERTRTGPADLPSRWAQALPAAGIELRIRDQHRSDPPVRYRRSRTWR